MHAVSDRSLILSSLAAYVGLAATSATTLLLLGCSESPSPPAAASAASSATAVDSAVPAAVPPQSSEALVHTPTPTSLNEFFASLTAGCEAAEDAEPAERRNPKSGWFTPHRYVTERLANDAEELAIALEAVCNADGEQLPGAGDRFGTYFVSSCVLWALVKRNDDEGLTRLLSAIPMETTGPDGFYIEFALVYPYTNRSPDGLELLFSAYNRATDARVRENLAQSARRCYWMELRDIKSDDTAVAEARKRFEATRGTVKANESHSLAYSPGFFGISNFEPPPLLIPKEGPDEVDGRIRDE